ncbi:MAG: hypothetical protein Q9160_002130 [Pyrenula sp. 1 TL-2023]
MPYNTRRKSLSLPSLGIQLPNASRAHRSPPSARSPPSNTTDPIPPPTKRFKRSHDANPPSPPSTNGSRNVSPTANTQARPKSKRGAYEHTPPPSPGDSSGASKVDTEGISDDIVVAVIEQLEKTGNRPHLIKELATVLSATSDSVANSANPAALLSSRLSLYLKRPWTALAPCPLAKEQIPVHPRKVFFYLTTSPHQPLPENSDDIITPSVPQVKRITPSISSPSDDQDDIEMELRERSRLSPSPEVDLSTPEDRELVDAPDQPPAQAGTFDGRNPLDKTQWGSNGQRARNRAPSPPLEADERGFTETANAVRARGMSLNNVPVHSVDNSGLQIKSMEMEEMTVRRDQDLGLELFGQANNALAATASAMMSSPMMQPREMHMHSDARRGGGLTNLDMSFKDVEMTTAWELRSPENVELDELDGLFSGF